MVEVYKIVHGHVPPIINNLLVFSRKHTQYEEILDIL